MALYKIRYKGLSDVREMSQSDLKKAGVDGISGSLKFEAKNMFSQVVDGMTDRLKEILDAEGTFTIEEFDGDTGKMTKIISVGEVMDDTAATVVDSTTGQVSTAGESDPNADPVVASKKK